MALYYHDRRVRITSAELWIDGRPYPLGQLDRVWHRRRRTGGARSRYAARTGLMLGGGVVGLACFCAISTMLRMMEWSRLWSRHDLMAVVVLMVGFAAGAALTWPLWELVLSGMDRVHIHGMDTHELWARLGSEDLLLFSTSDALRFGQIYRALGRALEAD
jgi:Family of unknown function (DUF6232)